MSWYFGNWQDFLKKKACRYILQHYLGQFLKEKLSLDQLSLDLYNGTGKITDLNLDVQVSVIHFYLMDQAFSNIYVKSRHTIYILRCLHKANTCRLTYIIILNSSLPQASYTASTDF